MPKKTWTDDEIQLLKTVYGTMSIQELQSVHFPKKTKNSIKWQVERWNLGCRDSWSERDKKLLSDLSRCNVPNRVIGEIFGRSTQSVAVMASKLGIIRSTRNEINDQEETAKRGLYVGLDALTKGTLNELAATSILLEAGFNTFRPVMINHPTDYVAIDGNLVARIQVKTAIYDQKTKRFRVPLKSRAIHRQERTSYTEAEADFFLLTCPGTPHFYFIPIDTAKINEFANLYPTRIKQSHKGTDYEVFKNDLSPLKDYFQKEKNNQREISNHYSLETISVNAERKAWKSWEDEALKLLLPNGVPYSEISSLLKRNKNSLIHRAQRLGLKGSLKEEIDDSINRDFSRNIENIDAKLKGAVTENIAVNQLILHGYDIILPLKMNDRIDAVAIHESRCARIQIKGGFYDKYAKGYRVETSVKSLKTKERKGYTKDEVDLFVICCGFSEELYIIPIEELQGVNHIMLYPNRHVLQNRGKDYEVYRDNYKFISNVLSQRQDKRT